MPKINRYSHKNWVGKILFLSSSLFTITSYAAPIEKDTPIKSWRIVGSVAGGGAFSSHLSQSQTFPIVNPIRDEFFVYTPLRSNANNGLFDGFLGLEWSMHPRWAVQLGVGYDLAGRNTLQGSLYQGADTQSANRYTWSYRLQTSQLLAESKLLYTDSSGYHPYIIGGLGSSFNTLSDFTTNVPSTLAFTRQYSNHTQNSFAYSVGVGVDVDVQEHIRLGFGYRYLGWGKTQSGSAKIDATPVTGLLTSNHLSANVLLAQLTVLI